MTFNLNYQVKAFCSMKYKRGFTLIELLISLAIISILLAVGLPSFTDDFDKKKLITASEQLYSHLQQARIESISRSNSITLVFAGTTTWQYGYREGIVACDPAITSATAATACIVIINDGDAIIDGINGGADDDDKVLKRFTNGQFSDVSIALSGFTNANTNQITFNPLRGISDSGQIKLTLGSFNLSVNVTALGMIKVCDPDGSGGFHNVSSC